MRCCYHRSKSNTNCKTPRDMEEILLCIYGSGLYYILLTAFCSIAGFMEAFELQSPNFLHYQPSFNCTDPRLKEVIEITWLPPRDISDGVSYNNSMTSSLQLEQCRGLMLRFNSTSPEEFVCQQWQYDKSVMTRTFTTEFNLVCESTYIQRWLEFVFLLSIALGCTLSFVSDAFGRRKVMLVLAAVDATFTIATGFATSVSLMFVFRFARGLSTALGYIGVCLVCELVPIDKRGVYGNNFWFSWSLGYMATAGIAYLTRDWRTLRYWGNAPLVIYLSYIYFVVESPRWLLLQKRSKEAKTILCRIARWNGATITSEEICHAVDNLMSTGGVSEYPNHNLDTQCDANETHVRKDRICDVITSRITRTKTLIFCAVHTCITLTYAGFITNANFASDNLFFNVFFMGLVEIPTGIVAWKMSDLLGRRFSTSILLILSAIAVIVSTFTEVPVPIVRTIAALVGKFFLTTAYTVADVYITELFPTSVRSVGLFATVSFAGMFGATAPFVNGLRDRVFYLPGIIYATMCTMGGVLVYLCLPETKDCPLPQTIYEAEQLKRGKEKEWAKMMHLKVVQKMQP